MDAQESLFPDDAADGLDYERPQSEWDEEIDRLVRAKAAGELVSDPFDDSDPDRISDMNLHREIFEAPAVDPDGSDPFAPGGRLFHATGAGWAAGAVPRQADNALFLTATGYFEGISYSLVADPTLPPSPVTGIVVQAPTELISAMEAVTGHRVDFTATGPFGTASLVTIDGVMAALLAVSEVTSFGGAVPEWWHEIENPRLDVDH